jgi:hypothetical protein
MNEKIKEHLELVAHVLGKTHGAIFNILSKPTEQLRPSLQELFDTMNEDILKLYFPTHRE